MAAKMVAMEHQNHQNLPRLPSPSFKVLQLPWQPGPKLLLPLQLMVLVVGTTEIQFVVTGLMVRVALCMGSGRSIRIP